MLSKQVEKEVLIMTGGDKIPSAFEPLYNAVKLYADRSHGRQGLSTETLALILAVSTQSKQAMPTEQPESTETREEPEPEPEDVPDIPVFMLGSKVSMYVEGEAMTGEVTKLPYGKEKRYKVVLDDDTENFRMAFANELFMAD